MDVFFEGSSVRGSLGPRLIPNTVILNARIPLAGKVSYRSECMFKKTSNLHLSGVGRSFSPHLSRQKAIGELIERLVMTTVLREQNYLKVHEAEVTTGSLLVGKIRNDFPKIPPGLCNSSGWAYYPNLAGAIKNAYFEAAERTILQASFFQHGWKGFSCVSVDEFYGFKVASLVANKCLGEIGAGIVVFKLLKQGGVTLGYIADRKSNLTKSSRWLQALAVGFEPAVAFENLGRASKLLDDPLAKIQSRYALKGSLSRSLRWAGREAPKRYSKIESKSGAVNLNLVAFKILKGNKTIGYVACCMAGDLLPLLLPELIGPLEKRFLAKTSLWRNGKFEVPKNHPII